MNEIKLCPVCGKPMEHVLTNGRRVPCLCACRASAEAEKRAEWNAQQRAHRQRIRAEQARNSAITGKNSKARFATACMNDHIRHCQQYVNDFDIARAKGIGMMFWGPTGTGKSFGAACIVNALADRGISAKLVSAAQIGDMNATEIMDIAHGYDLVVLDDFGTQAMTDYRKERLYLFVNERYDDGRPFIVTTNTSPDVLMSIAERDVSYYRIYDRLMEMCPPVMVNGGSYRPQAATETRRVLQMILT